VTVLTYHRIGDPAQAEAFDAGVVDARPEALDRQVAFLKRRCNVIALDDLRAFRSGGTLPPNPVLLTFDDGYRDNHDIALPILQRHGVSAVFFIATSYIEQRRLFWWDRVAYLLKRSSREVLDLEYPRKRSIPLGASKEERARALKRTMSIIKAHHGLDLERFLDEVEAKSGASLARSDERAMVDELLMTWDEVRAMRRGGMSVQSHTRTHRVLHTLSDADLKTELEGSRAELEAVLNEPVYAIAYPVGRSLDTAPHVRTALRAAGYDLAFSNGSGVNLAWKFDAVDVKRMSMEADMADTLFQGLLALPNLAYELRAAPET